MGLDVSKFFQATQPAKTLNLQNDEEKRYYIDFSSVRGGQIVEELKDNITFLSPDEPTCNLFTGHIGCGKSTELLQLKAELEHEDFHVVYFESSDNLEMVDVDIADILLAIAARVSESLQPSTIEQPKRLNTLLQEAEQSLQTEVGLEASLINTATEEQISLSLHIGRISAKAKVPNIRSRLREYLEPRTAHLIDAINQELLQPAINNLKLQGKKGLVVIVDNLDRVDISLKPWGRTQPEYLFVDRGDHLRKLKCHLIYTIPLALIFSNELATLIQRFGVQPKVLPMVPVGQRDGSECQEGMDLLRQMVLARAFPHLNPEQRINKIQEVFDSPETLDRLCRVSGGHVRNLLRLLNECIKKQRKLPLTSEFLEDVIREHYNQRVLAITNDEWVLLEKVAQEKKIVAKEQCQTLLRSMFVYEYRDIEGSWFDVNPLFAEKIEFKFRLESQNQHTEKPAKDVIDTIIFAGLKKLSKNYEEFFVTKDYSKAFDVAVSAYYFCQKIVVLRYIVCLINK
ncbi:KAP family P-loop domain-containing protein [Nostoc minutum NIES-26]|uniref:KAP family P-loop domain-containing protein n=1 Tax=Nostoc minutum NIES-26 TaxID=1844469 RepID=A0A367QS31_9NOSO|nr:KAP family P-loop domain-containing protein [Nostoc minutum NIES-26]